jgi:hypothetical protein
MRYPRAEVQPPTTYGGLGTGYSASDGPDRAYVETNNHSFQKALEVRGFRLVKDGRAKLWIGPTEVVFSDWHVADADLCFSRDSLDAILTAIDMGLSNKTFSYSEISRGLA